MSQELQKLRVIVGRHLETSSMPHKEVADIFELINKQQQTIQKQRQQIKNLKDNGDRSKPQDT